MAPLSSPGRDGVSLLEGGAERRGDAITGSADRSTRKITVVRDLPHGGGPVLWKQLDGKVRSQVRRPQKEGVQVRFGVDQVAPFFSIFARHMRDLGTPTQPKRLFEALVDAFPDDVWFGCAYLGKEAIAAGCGFHWGNRPDDVRIGARSAQTDRRQHAAFGHHVRAADTGLTAFNSAGARLTATHRSSASGDAR
jgi:hypothetical protein